MRILVIRAGALGDTAYASSVIEPLRKSYGSSTSIDWAATQGMQSLFRADPRIKRVFGLASRRLPLLFNRDKWTIVCASWRHPYDLVINLETGTPLDSVMRLIKAKKKVGSPYHHFKDLEGHHAIENLRLIYRSFMDATALQCAQPKLIGTDPSLVMNRFGLQKDYCVLVPSNSHHKSHRGINHRAWPIQHWKELIKRLAAKPRQLVIIGGKNEETLFKQLRPFPPQVLSLVGKTDLPDLIGLIAGSALVITTDTGPSHIAAAVNTPVYALIGPTNFKRTGPYQTSENIIKILKVGLPCSPCYHGPEQLKCHDNQCMKMLSPEQVLAALPK